MKNPREKVSQQPEASDVESKPRTSPIADNLRQQRAVPARSRSVSADRRDSRRRYPRLAPKIGKLRAVQRPRPSQALALAHAERIQPPGSAIQSSTTLVERYGWN